MTHEEKVAQWLQPLLARRPRGAPGDFGTEVGAFKLPVPGLRPIYVDRFAEYANERVLADYFGDLCALPFHDHALDYVVASHVLEHVANPVRALWECARVVQHDGLVYLVVPDRRRTFDHLRPLTPVAHMMDDFARGATDSDPTHISDYLDGVDWTRMNPAATEAANAATREELRAAYTHRASTGQDLNIHFHTFEPANFTALVAAMNAHPARPCTLEIVDRAENFPRERGDGLLFVLRVRKPAEAQTAGESFARRAGNAPERAVLADAKKFPPRSVQLAPASPPAPPAAKTPAVARTAVADPAAPSGHIDSPRDIDVCDPLCFPVEGWVQGGARHAEIERVEIWLNGTCAGHTARLFPRPDVNEVLSLAPERNAGFRLLGHCSNPVAASARLELRLKFCDGSSATLASVAARFATRDYRTNSFGILLRPDTVGIMRREHMYTSGPSLAHGSPEVVRLLQQYLPPPPARLVDVGCGLGYYGEILRGAGYDWLGVEKKKEDCADLARRGLPFHATDGGNLPFADNAFDAALCIEVLEHIDEPRAFLAELRRVAPRLIVSVPNAELIPYLHDHLATPRHMLDDDHRNFFTRWSLGSLLREFYPDVEVLLHTRHPLKTTEGAPLFYHLFAIAQRP